MNKIKLVRDSLDSVTVHAYTYINYDSIYKTRILHAGAMHIDSVEDFFGENVGDEIVKWDVVEVEVSARVTSADRR